MNECMACQHLLALEPAPLPDVFRLALAPSHVETVALIHALAERDDIDHDEATRRLWLEGFPVMVER